VPKFLSAVTFLTVRVSLSAIFLMTFGHLLCRCSSLHLSVSGHFNSRIILSAPLLIFCYCVQYFGETAHNPETNQRPSRLKSPETSAQHHRGTGQASMMRQQSPVPFSSLQPTSQQQQASSLPQPHHLRYHHRQQLTSQNQASSRPLLQNPPLVANVQGVKTATCPQTSRIAMPSAVDSSNLWSAQSVPASGNESQGGVVDRVTFYHGAGGDDANNGISSNFHSHVKGPSVRRSSNGNSASLKREGAYGYAGSGRCGGDLRAVGGGNESNLYYSVPGNERRMSLDNSVWSRGSMSSAMYKLRQSEDIMGSAGGGLAYPNSEGSRGLYCGQNVGSLAPSDSSMLNSSCGSTENIHLTTGGVNSLQRLHYSGAAGCRYSLDGGPSRRDSSVSLPANGLVRDSSSATEGSKDSLVSFDSTSTLTGAGQDLCSSDDSVIISRIRKSFEQKEEFLKRPSQPISWNISSGNQQQPSSPLLSQHAVIAREFYARPQKFQRPLWPPQNPGSLSPLLYRQQSPPRSSSSGKSNFSSSSSSNTCNKPTHQNLQRVKSDIDSERDSLSSHSSGEERPRNQQPISDPWDNNQTTIRGEFIYGGPVSNVPTTVLTKSALSQHTSPQFRPVTPVLPSTSPVTGNTSNGSTASLRHGSGGKSSFISTLTRIHENIPVSDPRASGETYASVINDAAEGVIDASRGSSSLPSSLPSSPSMGAATGDPGAHQPRSLLTPSEGNQNLSHVHPMIQLVSRRARQFETGRLDDEEGLLSDRTSLYRSELARLSSKRSVPNVAVRKREFESRSTSASTGGGAKDGRRLNRESRSLENAGNAVGLCFPCRSFCFRILVGDSTFLVICLTHLPDALSSLCSLYSTHVCGSCDPVMM